NALEAISRRMETEIFTPILNAPVEQLKEAFARAFQRYSGLYISLSFLLWSEIGDIASLVSIWTPIVAKFKAELESRGAETIGEEATNDMLVGLATVVLVNQKLFELAQTGGEVGDLKELQGWMISYWLASSCVYCYHFDRKGNSQNVRVLAYWSLYYAAGIYRCAKNLGVLKIPVGEDDSDELELMLNPNFIRAMSKIVQGLEESDIDWDKVRKVVPKF
ncbi:unnamed protein product, partial [marine sediment metagenome]